MSTTSSNDPHASYRSVWSKKPILRMLYEDYYRRIASKCVSGETIEIGGGIGQLKSFIPAAISSDIQHSPMIDVVADAQNLPFQSNALSNIVMLDVLHHIEFPVLFFREAERVLRPGGRCVMIEPAITFGSTLFYRLIHPEPVRMSAAPFVEGLPNPARDPYDSNQAIPTLLATRDRQQFERMFPNLEFVEVSWFSLWVYPLSGGFKPWSLMPEFLGRRVLMLEKSIESALGRFVGFRNMIVLQKKGG
ncbi:class I SAM-dependent methyltransferase [Bradyrhizobium sediminis]|uniref:Class I SAM-dependent methyltransferase n=1 Tax=Bradyrhizobium sediminis TaxID=2840469 RepID=A0A975P1C0_9BRAD|nr:class I SAM-dependent methyltransferase [Bradyrhizobium sediminis]QWG25117.1 class I SAM-dependent methyltransferase [Bradyrhizobium sediminis]